MKLQPALTPFPVLRFWVRTPWHSLVPWHVTGIFRPLLESRLRGEDEQKAAATQFDSARVYISELYD